MIVNRSKMLNSHLIWRDLLSTELREASKSLAYIQKAEPNASQPCASQHTESRANHLLYTDFFSSIHMIPFPLFFRLQNLLLLLLLLQGLLQGLLFVMLLIHGFNLIGLLLVGVPLASLQDQDTDKQQSQDGIASSQNLERIFSTKVIARIIGLAFDKSRVTIDTRSNDTHALDNVCNVYSDATHVQHKTGTVEQEVGFRRSVELGDEA